MRPGNQAMVLPVASAKRCSVAKRGLSWAQRVNELRHQEKASSDIRLGWFLDMDLDHGPKPPSLSLATSQVHR